MEVELVIRGARIVTSGRITPPGWIAIDGEKIVAIGSGESFPEAKRVIDANGKYVMPGVVDCEHHPSHPIKDAISTETCAAVASGTTTAGIIGTSVRMIYPEKEINRAEDMPSFMEASETFINLMTNRSMVDYFVTPGLTTEYHFKEIRQLAEKRGITSFKAYLHVMTGENIWEMWGSHPKKRGDFYYDDGSIYRAMVAIAEMGDPCVLLLHTENWEIARVIKETLLAEGRDDVAAYSDFSPAFCEAGHVRHYAYYANVTGCPIFIIHTTTPATVAEIKRAKEEGTKITANIAPHYLCLTPDYGSINVPLRPKEYHDAMWEALRTGAIDTVSSDSLWRATRTLEDVENFGLRSTRKNGWLESYFNGSNGFLLPVMLSEGVSKGRISLEKLVEVCCENPAKIFGIYPQKGALAIGADADLVIIDLEKVKTVTRDMVISRGLWSVWEGWSFKGWPIMTILRGQVMMERKGEEPKPVIVGMPTGQYLSRKTREVGN
jgi:dihydroorotase-like cyclic amidohydrolase